MKPHNMDMHVHTRILQRVEINNIVFVATYSVSMLLSWNVISFVEFVDRLIHLLTI